MTAFPAIFREIEGLKSKNKEENLEFEGTDCTVYVTEKGETLEIYAYTNDGFLGIPRNVSFGSGDKDYGIGVIPATGVKNGKPFTDVMFLHVMKSGFSVIIDEEIIESKEFNYNGNSYSLVYTK